MKRLFTVGCSFTQYYWPTWSNFLSLDSTFDYYENWGLHGVGNKAIFERVVECVTEKDVGKEDTVIVQWSGPFRHDFFKRPNGWQNPGNVANLELFDEQWMKIFFDVEAYVFHTTNFIVAAQRLLDSTRCTWRMTSMDELGFFNKKQDIDFWDLNPKLIKYKPTFEKYKANWIPAIGFCKNGSTPGLHSWFDPAVDKTPWLDFHPTPAMSWNWASKNLLPSLNLTESDYQLREVQAVETFLSTIKKVDTSQQELHSEFSWYKNQDKKHGFPY